jgi:hypothetical protein
VLGPAPATIRPDSWSFPLLLHVVGAMLLVGSLVLCAIALLLALRDGSGPLLRLGWRSLLFGVIPSYVVMRVGAEWIVSKEHLSDSNDAWIGIGFGTADLGILLILVSTLLAGLAVRRLNRDGTIAAGLGRAATGLLGLLVLAYVVALWAMTTKPI